MMKLSGKVMIPGSKSHTIRALLISALARGSVEGKSESCLVSPLISADTLSARSMIEQLGALVCEEQTEDGLLCWRVQGIPAAEFHEGSTISIDVGNSGTSLYLGTAVASLFSRPVRFDGDSSIRKRSAKNLLHALQNLGVRIWSGPDFCCPYTIQGPIQGGKTSLSAPTSQYLSALLLALPLSAESCDTELYLELLNEHPYIDMTIEWLRGQGIQWYSQGYKRYKIPGGQCYRPFQCSIPADFSSATFFFCAAAITGSTIQLVGLNPTDSQGDKQTLDFLQRMGCQYHWYTRTDKGKSTITHILEFSGPSGGYRGLQGLELNLAQTPDALPAMAVTCACATGISRISHVAHARNKETDRIGCMSKELNTLGFTVQENPDGLTIHNRGPEEGPEIFLHTKRKRVVYGYEDHRIIMALSLLNLLQPKDPIVFDDSSHVAVTFPSFFRDLHSLCIGHESNKKNV